jgi:hypothetical protein
MLKRNLTAVAALLASAAFSANALSPAVVT